MVRIQELSIKFQDKLLLEGWKAMKLGGEKA